MYFLIWNILWHSFDMTLLSSVVHVLLYVDWISLLVYWENQKNGDTLFVCVHSADSDRTHVHPGCTEHLYSHHSFKHVLLLWELDIWVIYSHIHNILKKICRSKVSGEALCIFWVLWFYVCSNLGLFRKGTHKHSLLRSFWEHKNIHEIWHGAECSTSPGLTVTLT